MCLDAEDLLPEECTRAGMSKVWPGGKSWPMALGLSVFGVGIWILFDKESLLTFLNSDELRTVGAGLMLIGLVALAVSLLGMIGAAKDNRVLLFVYLVFLIVLVLGQLFVTLLLLLNRDKIERSLNQKVDEIIHEYGDHKSEDKLMDKIQSYESCCGKTSPADWLTNSYIQSLNLSRLHVLPCSCFSRYRPAGNSSWCSEVPDFNSSLHGQAHINSSYDQGCETKVSNWLQENTLTILSIDAALILIQASQFILTVNLYQAIGRRTSLKKTNRLNQSEHDPDNPEHNLDYGEPNYAYIDPMDPAHPHNHLEDPTHPDYHHDNHNYN